MSAALADLESFNVSLKTGFLLEEPLEYLPSPYEPWNQLAKRLHEVLPSGETRALVAQLPHISAKELQSYRELRLAHLQLTTIAAAYIWCEGEDLAAARLPANVAVPLWEVSQRLGVQPILSHVSMCLANYARRDDADQNVPLERAEQLRILYGRFVADYGNEWFFVITAEVELLFATSIPHILQGIRLATNWKDSSNACVDEMVRTLDSITQIMRNIKATLQRIPKHLPTDVFYSGFRPYLAGYTGAAFAKKGGLIFDGVSEQPIKLAGGSAAQSSTLPCIDAFLGVQHTGAEKEFLSDMRRYMPPEHKKFIETIAETSAVREMVQQCNHQQLTEAYNLCLASVADCRSQHIQIVTRYIIVASRKAEATKAYKALDTEGTGGTDIMPFLKAVRKDVEEGRI